jgi:hypothetical protein
MDERETILQQMEAQEQANTKLDNAITYARRLEEIIQAINLDTNTRLIVNSLVGEAKGKYNMYDE